MIPLTNDELAELDKARNLAPKREVAIRAAEEIRHLRNKVAELRAEVTRLDDLYWDAMSFYFTHDGGDSSPAE